MTEFQKRIFYDPVTDKTKVPLPQTPRDMSRIESHLRRTKYEKTLNWLIKYQGQELLVQRKTNTASYPDSVEQDDDHKNDFDGNNSFTKVQPIEQAFESFDPAEEIVDQRQTIDPSTITEDKLEAMFMSNEDFYDSIEDTTPVIDIEPELEQETILNNFTGDGPKDQVVISDDTISFYIRGLLSSSNFMDMQYAFGSQFETKYLYCKEELFAGDFIKLVRVDGTVVRYEIVAQENIGLINTVFRKYRLTNINE